MSVFNFTLINKYSAWEDNMAVPVYPALQFPTSAVSFNSRHIPWNCIFAAAVSGVENCITGNLFQRDDCLNRHMYTVLQLAALDIDGCSIPVMLLSTFDVYTWRLKQFWIRSSYVTTRQNLSWLPCAYLGSLFTNNQAAPAVNIYSLRLFLMAHYVRLHAREECTVYTVDSL